MDGWTWLWASVFHTMCSPTKILNRDAFKEVFKEALEIVHYGLTSKQLDHSGKRFGYFYDTT